MPETNDIMKISRNHSIYLQLEKMIVVAIGRAVLNTTSGRLNAVDMHDEAHKLLDAVIRFDNEIGF
jgi:hypothetical protein